MMFDPTAVLQRNSKAQVSRQITEWVREGLPSAIKEVLRVDPTHVLINVREVQCGDPTCSPLDTVLMFIFKNGRRVTTGLPLEMAQVVRGDVESAMSNAEAELIACHENRDFHDTPMLPPLSRQGEAALERITAVLRREFITLSPADVVGVCGAAIDMLEQIEEEASRPPAARMIQQAGQRGGLDPNAKILSASQKNDVETVKAFVENERISPSYANSLGQTPLHIAAMWGNAETVDYLIKAGADVHAINQLSSATPLHVAASSNKDLDGRYRSAKLLLDAGADPFKRDADGLVPWQKVQEPGPLRELLQLAAKPAP